MTRGEASKFLNAVMEAIDALEKGIQQVPRAKDRIHAIRDAVVLLALDLHLPVQEKTDGKGDRLAGETG